MDDLRSNTNAVMHTAELSGDKNVVKNPHKPPGV